MDPQTKIRNIAFLDPSDPGYHMFVEESRLANMRIRESRGNRDYSDRISGQFEQVVREWLKPVGGSAKRILSYERLDRNGRYITRYREPERSSKKIGVNLMTAIGSGCPDTVMDRALSGPEIRQIDNFRSYYLILYLARTIHPISLYSLFLG